MYIKATLGVEFVIVFFGRKYLISYPNFRRPYLMSYVQEFLDRLTYKSAKCFEIIFRGKSYNLDFSIPSYMSIKLKIYEVST